ncbi:MAG: tetratricopeptide repeat protein [Pirellula sp.]|nr:tetratricopeptide repeat protein [Pirellula sp.]
MATIFPLGKIPMIVRWAGAIATTILFWIVALGLSDTAQKFPMDYWMLWGSRIVLCAMFHGSWAVCYPPLFLEKISANRLAIVPVALVVLILPATFGLSEVKRFTEGTQSSINGKRFVRAYNNALRLLQLDSSVKMDGIDVTRVARELRDQIQETEERLTTKQSTAVVSPSQAVMYLLSLSRVDEAEALWAKLPSDAQDTKVLGILVAREASDWKLVRQRCLEYLRLPPDEMRATVLHALAEAHGNMGEISESIQVFEQMIRTLPSKGDQAIAHFRLGLIYLEKGDSAQSWEHLNQAIASDPSLENEAKMKFARLKNFSCQLRGF